MNKVKFTILAASLGFALVFCEEKSGGKSSNNSVKSLPSEAVFDSASFNDWAQKVSVNIAGLNLGDNIRNDIEWRKKWVAQLKETEETFYKMIETAAPPYKLFYSTVIETKNINYQTETADLSIPIYLFANFEWFDSMQRSLKIAQAVMDGLNATNRKKDWGLDKWPWQGVSNSNPFGRMEYNYVHSTYEHPVYDKKPIKKQYDIPVVFELVNQNGKVIGKQQLNVNPAFSINIIDNRFVISFTPKVSSVFGFNTVNANDISDNLTIRLVSVNGALPKNARFPITAISTKEPTENTIKLIVFTDSRDSKKYETVEIGAQIWMAENLNYATEGSKCYDNDLVNCEKYGRLYDWKTATKACPNGWHLPNDKEWQALVDFAGGDNVAGNVLRAKSGWNNPEGKVFDKDDYGFSALPGGYSYVSSSCSFSYWVKDEKKDCFNYAGKTGYWWSATEIDNTMESISYHMNSGYLNYSNNVDNKVYKSGERKTSFYSVRCVKDE